MESSRRLFLKIAGVSAVGAGIAAPPVLKALANTSEVHEKGAPQTAKAGSTAASATEEKSQSQGYRMTPPEKGLKAKQWAMVIDTRQWKTEKDLEPMIEACNRVHNIPVFSNKNHEIKWIWETEFHNAFPEKANAYLDEQVEERPYLVLCNHCQNPPCVRACPTQATFKNESDGIVMMDFHRCIGCRFCMAACPYGSRSFNFVNPQPAIPPENYNPAFPRRMKGVVEKCNFCVERLAEGKKPACVEASKGAIVFGDLEDPNSPVRELLKKNFTIRRKEELGTGPSVFYIV
jgi:Fe-S-cluster-containing dehydrogenase component